MTRRHCGHGIAIPQLSWGYIIPSNWNIREDHTMPVSGFYTWEKCNVAVRNLASGTGNLRDRLSDAWGHGLHHLVGQPIPWPDLQQEFNKIAAKLVPEVSVGADARSAMQDDDLRRLASDIVDFYDLVCGRYAVENVPTP